jgi:hypothetical protein
MNTNSIFSIETVKSVSDSLNLSIQNTNSNGNSTTVYSILLQDLEYRIRQIIEVSS